MKTLRFFDPDESWLDFVLANRAGEKRKGDCDLIIGPVANDNVYETVALYVQGIINKPEALSRLKTYKLFDQYVFASEKGLKALRFLKTMEEKE